jgi:hypothetical protein
MFRKIIYTWCIGGSDLFLDAIQHEWKRDRNNTYNKHLLYGDRHRIWRLQRHRRELLLDTAFSDNNDFG